MVELSLINPWAQNKKKGFSQQPDMDHVTWYRFDFGLELKLSTSYCALLSLTPVAAPWEKTLAWKVDFLKIWAFFNTKTILTIPLWTALLRFDEVSFSVACIRKYKWSKILDP